MLIDVDEMEIRYGEIDSFFSFYWQKSYKNQKTFIIFCALCLKHMISVTDYLQIKLQDLLFDKCFLDKNRQDHTWSVNLFNNS